MTFIDLFPSSFWFDVALGISLMLNVILLIVVVGIVYPFRKIDPNRVNYRIVDICIGCLFGVLGNMVVAVMQGTAPFNNVIVALLVLSAFCGNLFLLLLRIERNEV